MPGRCDRDGDPSPADLRAAYAAAAPDRTLRERVTLLDCTSSYPAESSEVHLAAMDTLAQAFDLPVGYSDNPLGTAVSIGAVARGGPILLTDAAAAPPFPSRARAPRAQDPGTALVDRPYVHLRRRGSDRRG